MRRFAEKVRRWGGRTWTSPSSEPEPQSAASTSVRGKFTGSPHALYARAAATSESEYPDFVTPRTVLIHFHLRNTRRWRRIKRLEDNRLRVNTKITSRKFSSLKAQTSELKSQISKLRTQISKVETQHSVKKDLASSRVKRDLVRCACAQNRGIKPYLSESCLKVPCDSLCIVHARQKVHTPNERLPASH